MMRHNVLISTTRQWNPGDEFIMQGAINILQYTFGDVFNPIIFNRNPDIRVGSGWRNFTCKKDYTYKWDQKTFKGKSILQELLRIGHYDNSWKDDMNAKNLSLALFAGSPEWYGKRLIPMYKLIVQERVPTVFVGLGAGDSTAFENVIPEVQEVLASAKMITTRDRATERLLENFHAKYVPCPAFLAAKKNKIVHEVNKVGLIYATNRTLKGNNVSSEMHDYILKLYPEIAKKYNVGLVCHYIDEIDQARVEFPNFDIYYSYDSKDYEDIYNNFDLVVGGRVHGIGMSASLGIPGVMIKHDARSDTTDGFLAHSVMAETPVEGALYEIAEVARNVEIESERLMRHKQSVMEEYSIMLKQSMDICLV